MKQFELESLETVVDSVESKVNSLIDQSNTATTDLYNLLHTTTDSIQSMRKKVAVLGDMITDLSIINGKTKNTVYFSDLDIYSSKGISVEDGDITLGRLRDTNIEYSIKDSSVISSKPVMLSGSTGRAKTMEEMFKYNTVTNLQVSNMGYSLTFVLRFPKMSKINQLVLELPLDAPSYPFLESIKITSPNNLAQVPVKIMKTNSYDFSLDDNRVVGNRYKIDIEPVDTKELQFTLNSKTENILSILSIATTFNTYETRGEIIFGPIISDTPILKVGLASTDSSDNVDLSVSTDLENWISMTDSFRISAEDSRKVVAFNTVNETSFKSDNPINTLYVKAVLESSPIESILNSLSYDSYREDSSISGDTIELVDDSRFSAFRIQLNDFAHGIEMYASGTELTPALKKDSSVIKINGVTRVIGFDETHLSVGQKTENQNNVSIMLNNLRLPASSDIDASVFDSVGSELYDIILVPLTGRVNVLSERNVGIKLTKKEDDYRLVTKVSKRFIDISITSNFITNNTKALYQVPEEDILLLDSLGNVIKEFKKEDHLTLVDSDITIKFISLIGILYELPKVDKLIPNLLYPFTALSDNEYSVVDSQIVVGQGSIVEVSGYRILKTKVNKRLDISYQNGNVWERLDPLYTYHNTQIDTGAKETTIIKLDHRSIEKGSLEIFEYNAYESLSDESNVYIAVDNHYMNENKYITEESGTDTYIKE